MGAVRFFSAVGGVLLAVALAAVLAFILGIRHRNPRVLRIARIVQRDYMNAGALRTAGRPGSQWAVIRVPGRRSGKIYDTPVGVQRQGNELFITMPYGEGTQWVQNVRTAGRATVLHGGVEIEVVEPELVPIGQTPTATADRVAIAIFGVTQALRLRVVSEVTAATASM